MRKTPHTALVLSTYISILVFGLLSNLAQAGFMNSLKKASAQAAEEISKVTKTAESNVHNTISMDDALDQQADIGRSVTNSLMYLAEAQFLMADAVGLREEALIAQSNAEALAAGEVSGEADLEQRLSTSAELTQAIATKMEAGTTLDDEGREKFKAAIPPYTMGTTTMVLSAKMAAASARAITSSGDPMIITRIAEIKYLITFGKAAPELISSFRSANQLIISFSQANGIDTSELESEIENW